VKNDKFTVIQFIYPYDKKEEGYRITRYPSKITTI